MTIVPLQAMGHSDDRTTRIEFNLLPLIWGVA